MMSRDELLRELTALDFVALDLALFLDTHPDDRQALDQYNQTIMQAYPLRQEYESTYGPLYSYRSASGYPWQWSKEPWPWQNDFNFEMM